MSSSDNVNQEFNTGPYTCFIDALDALTFMDRNADSIPGSERSISCRNARSYFERLFAAAALVASSCLQMRETTFLPILKRAVQDHAFGAIARTVVSSCLSTDRRDSRGNQFVVAERGPVAFKTYRKSLILALEADERKPFGDEADENMIWKTYFDRSDTLPDFAETLRESIINMARPDLDSLAQTGSGVTWSSPLSAIANQMALQLLEDTEKECFRLDKNFTRPHNESHKLLTVLMFILPRIWTKFIENLTIVDNGNEYADLLSTNLMDRLRRHLTSYEIVQGAHSSQQLDDDDAVQKACQAVHDMLPTMSFLLNARSLAYIINTSNLDREQANEIVHPSLETIRESIEEFSAASGSDLTDQAGVIFRAMDEPESATGVLLESATNVLMSIVLGHLK